MELSIGCVRLLPGAFADRTRKVDFSIQIIVEFALILVVHALELDHHAALLNFRANLRKQAKTEGFFQQRKLRKIDTAREVCVGMEAQIDVLKWPLLIRKPGTENTTLAKKNCYSREIHEVDL